MKDKKSPVVQITAPVEGSTYTVGDTIEFTGSANDSKDSVLSGESLVWSSDLDGQIGTGETCSTATLSAGIHQITLTGTDENEAVGTDTMSITVNAAPDDDEDDNEPPVVQITAPAEGSTYTVGDTIEFTGSASDSEGGVLSGESLAWISDIDGQIGTGEICNTVTLSAGTHQITLTGTDANGVVGTDTMSIIVNAAPAAGSLPDTGQITSHTDTFGEDADYTINPQSYSKLDGAGNEMHDGAPDWTLVRDNVTGLIWEVKKDIPGSIHHSHRLYDWQEAQDTYITQLNSDNFGGYSDWRLPTIKELSTLVHADSSSPAINSDYFPTTRFAHATPYWSSTSYDYGPEFAWGVEFENGYVGARDKIYTAYVRAVRGGQ